MRRENRMVEELDYAREMARSIGEDDCDECAIKECLGILHRVQGWHLSSPYEFLRIALCTVKEQRAKQALGNPYAYLNGVLNHMRDEWKNGKKVKGNVRRYY